MNDDYDNSKTDKEALEKAKRAERTDTERLNFLLSLDYPVLETDTMPGCKCGCCHGWKLSADGKFAWDDFLRGAIDDFMDGNTRDEEK